jgi:LmbE family N-acetylglucosaminyl deacetylase/DNA-binding NarL/FixJ family response regulator
MIDTLTLNYTQDSPSTRKRVLLVDDHAVVRKGLAMLINDEADMQVCGEAEDERAAREAAASLRPDVAVVDWSLGQTEASELVRSFHNTYPEMPVLVLSMHDEIFYAERVLKVGASGYVMKREATDRVIEGIRRTAAGHFYFTDRAIEALPEALRAAVRRKGEHDTPQQSPGQMPAVSGQTPVADLVVAPHPDDETFGCGGTIRLVTEGGTPVDVVFMTRGERGHEDGQGISEEKQHALAYERTNEALNACKALGVRQVSFLAGSDTQLREQAHLSADLRTVIDQGCYRRVFCPWAQDGHEDHIATFGLLRAALSGYEPEMQVWLYEVWTPLPFNMLIPIDQTIRHKRKAIEHYRSQLSQLNYREGFIGLSAYRGAFCPPANFAEAFQVCTKEEILAL